MKTEKKYNITIVGAGLVGSSLALALALQSNDFNIAVLEKHRFDCTDNTQRDRRPIVLSYGTMMVFKRLKVWESLIPCATKIKRVTVSEKSAFGATHFSADEEKLPALGYVLPFYELRHILYQRMASEKKITIIPVSELLSIENRSKKKAKLIIETTTGKVTIQTDLVAACDGARSSVRELLGIKNYEKDHGKHALTATITLCRMYDGTAHQRFTKDGVLAILPLAHSTSTIDKPQCAFIWTMKIEKLKDVNNWDKNTFIKNIQQSFSNQLPPIQEIAIDRSYPLHTSFITEDVHPHVVLLGNAAHTLYPLAAQGFNLGCRDAQCLANIISKAHQTFKPLGSLSVLQEYKTSRARDQKCIRHFTSSMIKVFLCHFPLMSPIRGLSLLTVDLLLPLKKHLTKQLLGL